MPSQKRRNRKRSKRRAIYCPIHGCYLDSVSQKYRLYADKSEHLRDHGMSKKIASAVIANHKTVPLMDEWLESFWCEDCQQNEGYWVKRTEPRVYSLSKVPEELWQQVQGVSLPDGNPTVSEFTNRQSMRTAYRNVRDFAMYSNKRNAFRLLLLT